MKLINVPDLSPHDDGFTHLDLMTAVEWVRLTGLPSNALERNVQTIRLSRYRAAAQAVLKARNEDMIISHHPLMTNAVAMALRFSKQRPRHIAWAFNFTTLPTGLRLRLLSKELSRVERFIVFSEYEKSLYSRKFGLDEERFTNLLWAQDAPQIDSEYIPFINGPYVCAIGGEGRDIDIILKTAGKFDGNLKFVVVTRPHMVPNVPIPDNVSILCNLPSDKTWAIATKSLGVLVPLISDDKCCGHITIVSAKLLGLPIVTTSSVATEEYVRGREFILQSSVGDVDSFCEQVQVVVDRQNELSQLARSAQEQEANLHSRERWSDALNSIISNC